MARYERRPIGPNGPTTVERIRFVRRGLDVVIAATGLAVFAPILLLTAAAIKLDSHGPIFVRETRLRSKDVPVTVLRFRFATAGALSGYSRPTRVGSIFRDTGVSELPQLFNVLSGELSIVAR
jgi:lipopolysaccharide/colanic/teichoic acid biosynthesis glycosyltransferase